MEEILASIRRIIADDDANKTAKPPEPAAPAPVAARPTAVPPPPPPVAPPAAPSRPAMSQTDIDAVLAGEDKAKTAPAAPADILELTEAQTAQPPKKPEPAPNFRTIDGQSDVIFSDRPPEAAPEPAPRAMEEARRQFTQFSDRSLLSNTTAAAVDSAFNSLAHTVLGQNARTLEDLVKEMLRPMLKAWLDDNLPGVVDRIVRAEIERVSRGRG
jgi:cell pole-organizing protein PopZ